MGYHSMTDETTRASIASKLAKEREQALAQRSALTNALIAPCISVTSTASKAVTSVADRVAAKREREERRRAETARQNAGQTIRATFNERSCILRNNPIAQNTPKFYLKTPP
jgi:hypothetical protein